MRESKPVTSFVDSRKTIPAEMGLGAEWERIYSNMTCVQIESVFKLHLGHVADTEVVLVATLVQINRVVKEEVKITQTTCAMNLLVFFDGVSGSQHRIIVSRKWRKPCEIVVEFASDVAENEIEAMRRN